MTDIVEKNRRDWEGYSERYMAFNLSDSVLERLKVVKPYDSTGPFEDETTVSFAWRVQDIVNPILDAGIRLMRMEEIMPKPDYEHPFFVKNEEIVNGRRLSREEVDAMYDWRQNPAAALPEMIALAGRRDGQG